MPIQEVVLQAGSLETLRDFYGTRLGLPVSGGFDRLSLAVGKSTLTFVPGEGLYHFAFNIHPSLFAEGKAWLAERVDLLTDASGHDEFAFSFWDARAVYARDPAGNIFELIARAELADEPVTPFGLREISEIGVPTDDLEAVRRDVQRELGLEVYRDTWKEGFGALGDAHGLLILVAHDRLWSPDDRDRARPCPLEVKLDAGWLAGPPYRVERPH